jgi:hypothetical protein
MFNPISSTLLKFQDYEVDAIPSPFSFAQQWIRIVLYSDWLFILKISLFLLYPLKFVY